MAEPILTLRIEGLETLQKALTDPELVKGPIKDALTRAGHTVEIRAKEKVPSDRGTLKASIVPMVEETRVVIGTNLKYAPAIEFGSRPHFPPPLAIEGWVWRNRGKFGFGKRRGRTVRDEIGQIAYAIMQQIAHHGTRPHPFLVPALLESKPDIEGFLRDAARQIEAKWGKHG